MVRIDYFLTSTERYYRIGTTGEWLLYQDQPIKVDEGETLYAQGKDKYEKESLVSNYVSSINDAVGKEAFDGDLTTYAIIKNVEKYMVVILIVE